MRLDKRSGASAGVERKVPLFVFPPTLEFYMNNRETHKQVLTIYNPYDLPVEFLVKSTSPNTYNVNDSQGTIGPMAFVDIIVRHIAPIPMKLNHIDKIRVIMRDKITKKVIGKRDLLAELLLEQDQKQVTDDDAFNIVPSQFNSETRSTAYFAQYPFRDESPISTKQNKTNEPSWIVIVLGLICITGLFLPNDIDKYAQIPSCLHINNHMKNIFAFVLGLVTMSVLRP